MELNQGKNHQAEIGHYGSSCDLRESIIATTIKYSKPLQPEVPGSSQIREHQKFLYRAAQNQSHLVLLFISLLELYLRYALPNL